MIISQRWIPYCFYFLLISFVGAQESQSSSDTENTEVATVLKDTLSVHISTKLYQNEDKLIWGTDVTRLTIPGRAVTLNLKNDQAKLSVHFTPYKKEGEILLIAQSEIWLKERVIPNESEKTAEESIDQDKEIIRYFTSIKSAPMKYGEELIFFPLGKLSVENNVEEIYIEMAIDILPYKTPLNHKDEIQSIEKATPSDFDQE